ncbi:MAG: sigma-70 family RNA polymerase sigma factor [Terricaulis sp.]
MLRSGPVSKTWFWWGIYGAGGGMDQVIRSIGSHVPPAMSTLVLAPAPRGLRASPRARRGFAVSSELGQSDEQLLTRVGRGEKQAFATLFMRYAPKVKSYLMRLGAGAAAAEDLAQDAMVSVWRRAASYDANRARPSTWVFVIARNAWIDRLRREKVELAYRNENPPPQHDQSEAPDDAAERLGEEAHIAEAMATLSDEQLQVVRLSFFEDRPHSEIAQRLSLPLGTVKSRLRLALIKLRAHWEQYS